MCGVHNQQLYLIRELVSNLQAVRNSPGSAQTPLPPRPLGELAPFVLEPAHPRCSTRASSLGARTGVAPESRCHGQQPPVGSRSRIARIKRVGVTVRRPRRSADVPVFRPARVAMIRVQ